MAPAIQFITVNIAELDIFPEILPNLSTAKDSYRGTTTLTFPGLQKLPHDQMVTRAGTMLMMGLLPFI
jgi:hypothetical protein